MTHPGSPRLSLADGLERSGLTIDELWQRQLSVGGDLGTLELEAYILGFLRPDRHHHDLIAQALNEHFIDQGQDHPVAYYADQLQTP